MKTKYIECACYSSEHTLKFTYFPDEKELCVTTFLAHRPFLKRVINGLKYIFGYKCEYGHFDETILEEEKIKELQDFLSKL